MRTTSLELSKRLKEAGVPQRSFFYYDVYGNLGQSNGLSMHLAHCFTSDELLELLPKTLPCPIPDVCEEAPHTLALSVEWNDVDSAWDVQYYGSGHKGSQNVNLCDALAELLLWCIAEGYVEVKK